MVKKIVYSSGERMPASRPMLSTISSVRPRVLRRIARAASSCRSRRRACAASTLASAFGPLPGADAREQRREARPAQRATDELSLENVFRSADRKSGAVRQASGFSFDQFFAEGAVGHGEARTTDPTGLPSAEEAPSPDDIEQFNAWLEGLKKK